MANIKTTTMADDEEVIFIVVDNSIFMRNKFSGCCDNQLEAIRLYCLAKLQSNPKNAIGFKTMGGLGVFSSYLAPTTDVDKIMTYLHRGILYGGDLDLIRGVTSSLLLTMQPQFPAKHKRLLFFVGGPTNLSFQLAVSYGELAKEIGVAVDVVNFWPKLKRTLDGFVAAADINGNSHVKHIQHGSSLRETRDALTSFPPIITLELIDQGEIAAAARKKKAKEKADRIELKLLNRKGKNETLEPPIIR